MPTDIFYYLYTSYSCRGAQVFRVETFAEVVVAAAASGDPGGGVSTASSNASQAWINKYEVYTLAM